MSLELIRCQGLEINTGSAVIPLIVIVEHPVINHISGWDPSGNGVCQRGEEAHIEPT